MARLILKVNPYSGDLTGTMIFCSKTIGVKHLVFSTCCFFPHFLLYSYSYVLIFKFNRMTCYFVIILVHAD